MENLKFKQYIEEKKEKEWREETASGQLLTKLEEIAKQEKVPVQVLISTKNELVEIFHYGEETASLRKHLRNASIGETGGMIELCVEGWEYKRKPWWKKAIDMEKISPRFLNTPIAYAAKDAQIPEVRDYFIPPYVIKKFFPTSGGDISQYEKMKQWVNEEIIRELSPLVDPDYHLGVSDLYVRLVPNTPEAAQSILEDNDTYKRLLQKIKQADIIRMLGEAYEKKAKEQRKSS